MPFSGDKGSFYILSFVEITTDCGRLHNNKRNKNRNRLLCVRVYLEQRKCAYPTVTKTYFVCKTVTQKGFQMKT